VKVTTETFATFATFSGTRDEARPVTLRPLNAFIPTAMFAAQNRWILRNVLRCAGVDGSNPAAVWAAVKNRPPLCFFTFTIERAKS
jgi:hypothetical protein